MFHLTTALNATMVEAKAKIKNALRNKRKERLRQLRVCDIWTKMDEESSWLHLIVF